MKEEIFEAFDGAKIALCVWDEVTGAKGVVQIVHGMAEHIRRYDDFARFLNAHGYIVTGDDHRAHGRTAELAAGQEGSEGDRGEAEAHRAHGRTAELAAGQEGSEGDRGEAANQKERKIYGFAGGDIALDTVRDEREITAMLKQKYGLPVILLGHSYGSFITQEYLLQGTESLAGVILSGSAHQGGLINKLGYIMANARCKNNPKGDGDVFAKMTFVTYDKKVKEGLNGWLSRDKSEVAKYNADKRNGFLCSNCFYKSMLGMFRGLYKKERLDKIDKNLKLLVTSGGSDYVGANGKLVKKLASMYSGRGIKVKYRLYNSARHEILNETNKSEVYNDMLIFIESCLTAF